jgi:hypothetical protein
MSNPAPPPIPPLNQPPQQPPQNLTGRQAYNVVSDTVTGLNVRWKDNVFQAVGALVCGVIAFIVVLFISNNDLGVAILAGVGGLIVGVFVVGVFLMIYRGVKHLQGKHD